MRIRFLATAAFLLLVPLSVLGYTSPGAPTGHVNDYANLLPTEERTVLEQTLEKFTRETSNEIAVVTISSLQGDTIENFAEKLFQEWGIGKAKEDNGVLLLIAKEDRQVRIEVGYGLEGALTDIQANDIIENDIVPAFRAERYASGIIAAVDNIMAATRNEYLVRSNQIELSRMGSFVDEWGGYLLFLAFILIQWLGSMLARSKSWWGGGIVGGGVALLATWFFGFLFVGLILLVVLVPAGLLLDYLVSNAYAKANRGGKKNHIPWWAGGGYSGGSSGGGSFGGFGGGGSGGGGSSGGW